jgi:hypothetical protein
MTTILNADTSHQGNRLQDENEARKQGMRILLMRQVGATIVSRFRYSKPPVVIG